MSQHGSVDRDARILRAWQLAILRFAVTQDDADRLGVLAIAGEIDRLGRQRRDTADFDFFRRTSERLCTAMLQRNEIADAILRQYLTRIDDARLKSAFAAALELDQPEKAPAKRRCEPEKDLWRGLPSRGSVQQ